MATSAGNGTGPAVWVRGLWKTYGRLGVLRGLDLEVPWGQFLTILGPNGSGKTTLMKVLATLSRPASGEIRIAGIDPRRNAPAVRRLIGVVTHQPLLYGDLTPAENLTFYSRMFGIPNAEERIHEVVEMVGMEAWLNVRVRTLSHGMQKRVSIARALLHDPPILLLDEPETGLDPVAQERLGEILHDLLRGGERTVVMTTHNLERGLALADEVAIISGGRIAYQESREAARLADLRLTYQRYTGARA